MLDDLVRANPLCSLRRRVTGELRATDRYAREIPGLVFADDDQEAEQHPALSSAPRGRVHQQRRSHEVGREALDDLHRIVIVVRLAVPGVGSTWTRQLHPPAPNAHDQDLALDTPLRS